MASEHGVFNSPADAVRNVASAGAVWGFRATRPAAAGGAQLSYELRSPCNGFFSESLLLGWDDSCVFASADDRYPHSAMELRVSRLDDGHRAAALQIDGNA